MITRTLSLAALLLAAASLGSGTAVARSARTVPLPGITDVTFTTASDGTYTATITGHNFGAAPAGIPCTLCAPQQVQVNDLASPQSLDLKNVTAWSKTQITVSGISANPGDPIRLAIFNAAAGNAAAWGGLVSPSATAPIIKHIRVSGSGATLQMTVTGSGFGKAPAGALGMVTDSAFLLVSDYSAAAIVNGGMDSAGDYPWNAGFCGTGDCDGVKVGYVSWTPTKIVLSGFGGAYGYDGFVAAPGDALCIGVASTTGTSGNIGGGNVKCIRLPS
jgi:hypothetical protein